jgi:hypothetical protein
MTIEGITISEMIERTGFTRHVLEMRLHRLKIKPVINEFLYPADTLDRILSVKRGRRPSASKPDEP